MRCYFCDGTLATNDVLDTSRQGLHIIISVQQRCAWIACEACGRWNLPDVSNAEALLRECTRRFAAEGEVVAINGVSQVTIGKLRLTQVDSTNQDTSLMLRHTRRIERHSRTAQRLGIALAVVGMIGMQAGLQALGRVWGPVVGGVGFIAALYTTGMLQRRRKLSIQLTDGEVLTLTRGDATQAALVDTDHGAWALRLRTVAGVRLLQGTDALAALARLIPLFTRPADSESVAKAVSLVRTAPELDALVRPMVQAKNDELLAEPRRWSLLTAPWTIWALAPEQRLALEIVATEQHEREILELEVSQLTLRLREATEISDIIAKEFFF